MRPSSRVLLQACDSPLLGTSVCTDWPGFGSRNTSRDRGPGGPGTVERELYKQPSRGRTLFSGALTSRPTSRERTGGELLSFAFLAGLAGICSGALLFRQCSWRFSAPRSWQGITNFDSAGTGVAQLVGLSRHRPQTGHWRACLGAKKKTPLLFEVLSRWGPRRFRSPRSGLEVSP